MKKRDLKTDLELVENAIAYSTLQVWDSKNHMKFSQAFAKFKDNSHEIAKHALVRAIRYEDLVGDLVKALETIIDPTLWIEQFQEDTETVLDSDTIEYLMHDIELLKAVAAGALIVAKEALEDEKA